MRSYLTTFTLLLLSNILIVNSQSYNWQWARSIQGKQGEHIQGMVTDLNGNIYVDGEFTSDTIAFGNLALTGSFPLINFFIAKYDSSGNVLWAHTVVGAQETQCEGITSDVYGNVYAIGQFRSATLNFGGHVVTSADFSGQGLNVFLVKYDPEGNVVWARSAGQNHDVYVYGVTTDLQGNVYITGEFPGDTIAFGSVTLRTPTPGVFFHNAFIVKYDTNGNVLWGNSSGGDSDGVSVSVDKSNNVYLQGNFYDTLAFSGGTSLVNVNPDDGTDIFLQKFDSSGNPIWAKSFGGTDLDVTRRIIVSNSAEIYLLGLFWSPSVAFGNYILHNPAGTNIPQTFLVKLDTSGDVIWAQSIIDTAGLRATDMCADKDGNIMLGACAYSGITFGNTVFGSGYFVAQYSSLGDFVWAKAIERASSLEGISASASGRLNLGGGFTVGTLLLGNLSLVNTSYPIRTDGFVTQLNYGTDIQGDNGERKIFPNPFSSELTFAVSDTGQLTISLYNFLGQQVLQQTFTNSTTINTAQLAGGIYFYRLRNNKRTLKTGKVVKQ